MRWPAERAGEPIELALVVNGERRVVTAPPLARLLDVLRDELGLSGTKEGCGEGECGACTVLVDGEATLACLVPVCQVAHASIATIEGPGFEAIQTAFLAEGGAQCGICTPGMIAMTRAWIDGCEAQGIACTAAGARTALAGNLCRCTGYQKILAAAVAASHGEARVRSEEPRDAEAVHRVVTEAFGRAAEADLVERLRAHSARSISLVAELAVDRDAGAVAETERADGGRSERSIARVVGHVLFTPVEIADSPVAVKALGLAPLAVVPEVQRRGIGSKLVRRGLDLARAAGFELVVVVGDPEYYSRFGFERASRDSIACELECPDECFRVAWLVPPTGARGTARYVPDFASVV